MNDNHPGQPVATPRAQNMSRFDRILRRILPSTAILSSWKLFKLIGYLNDGLMSRFYPEFKSLPPNHLRVRVGVRNILFFNQVMCLKSGTNYWLSAFAAGICKLDSNIVEIGCGYGRKAMLLRDFNNQGEKFEGIYTGIDIDEELLEFGRKNFPADQFQFLNSPHRSKTYFDSSMAFAETTQAARDTLFSKEITSGSQDFVYSTSLFTHLLEPELCEYLELAYRALRPGGSMRMNYFCMDHLRNNGLLGERWTFQHRNGSAYVESPKYPEAAVAYDTDFMHSLCKEIGFSNIKTTMDPSGKARQSHLNCQR